MTDTSHRRLGRFLFSLALFAAVLFAWLQRNALYDWLRLHNYQPNAQIAALADQTTMTAYARHMFYINHPAIEDRTVFNQNCPDNGGEQTIVLGCYQPHETGIHLYSVTDPKLNGVEQVTAAHETLHAIYERLSNKDRNYVDGLLQAYYQHDLHDQRLLDTIKAYQSSEPNDVVNEMHSVFGTEVTALPPALEAYYAKYFTNRQQIVSFAAHYQQTFTDNQATADRLLSQIKALEKNIKSQQDQINLMETDLRSKNQSLSAARSDGVDIQTYNAQVTAYNAEVQTYRNLIATYNNLINQHNQLVAQYQAVSVENNQLIQELNSRSATVSAQ